MKKAAGGCEAVGTDTTGIRRNGRTSANPSRYTIVRQGCGNSGGPAVIMAQ